MSVFNRRRFTKFFVALWIALFAFTTGLTLYAARYWKVPEYSARSYWASRLTGLPQAFLGSDERWHYFALKGMSLHGWQVGRVGRQAAEEGRNAGVRAQIDDLVLSAEDRTTELQQLTGLAFDTPDAWTHWWRQHRLRWTWPAEQEQRWEAAVKAGWAPDDAAIAVRDWYLREIESLHRKIWLEVLYFLVLWLLIWPVVPCGLRALWAKCDERGSWMARLTLMTMVATGVLIIYFAAVFPHAHWGYGVGTSTTLSGPGYCIYSGPYPFRLHYKPGDTILYRQFLELVFDPTVRLAGTGLFERLPPAPLYSLGVIPYLAAGLIAGLVVAVRGHERVS